MPTKGQKRHAKEKQTYDNLDDEYINSDSEQDMLSNSQHSDSEDNQSVASDMDTVADEAVEENGRSVEPGPSHGDIATYVPPQQRKLQSSSESTRALRRILNGLLNRLSEANIEAVFNQMSDLFKTNPRRDVADALIDILLATHASNTRQLESLTMIHAVLIYLLHCDVGADIGALIIQNIVQKFDVIWKEVNENPSAADLDENGMGIGKSAMNLITLLACLYEFQVVSCVLIYAIVNEILACTNEFNIELLLRILRLSGHQLRQDDAAALRQIVADLQLKEKSQACGSSSRFRFLMEMIADMKNNKRRLVIQSDHIVNMKKLVKSIQAKKALNSPEALRVTLDDIRSVGVKGKWWVIGNAWAGNESQAAATVDAAIAETTKAHQAVLAVAKKQGMNTDIRKSIFVVLMTSEDYMDAFERLHKIGLKHKQEREIVLVILHCCGQVDAQNHLGAFN